MAAGEWTVTRNSAGQLILRYGEASIAQFAPAVTPERARAIAAVLQQALPSGGLSG